jgi:hypothetical protein
MSISLTLEDIHPCIIGNHTIMVTITNSGYLLYTLNMLKSLEPFGLDRKILVVCLDANAAKILRTRGYQVHCVEENGLSKFCPWNTKGYDRICYLKMEVIYRILSLNTHVLLVDGDIVFQTSPMPDLLQWQQDTMYDVWIQNDSQTNGNTKNMCTGYLFIKSSDRLRELYDCVSENGQRKYQVCAFNNNDQTYFNQFVKPYCIMNPLPLEQYPNGKMFYDHVNTIKKSAVLIHFNWVQGHMKMAKMKEHKMWLLTAEEEC